MKAAAAALVASLLCLPAIGEEAPRGYLLAIGGGSRPPSIMGRFASLAGGRHGLVLVLPQASQRPEAGGEIKEELLALGIGRVEVLDVDRRGADAESTLARTAGTTGVYLGGGDQSRLTAALLGTRLGARLHELYRQGAVIGGTSAGAAAMSRTLIVGEERRPLDKDEAWQTIEADNVVTAEGLGVYDLASHRVVRLRPR